MGKSKYFRGRSMKSGQHLNEVANRIRELIIDDNGLVGRIQNVEINCKTAKIVFDNKLSLVYDMNPKGKKGRVLELRNGEVLRSICYGDDRNLFKDFDSFIGLIKENYSNYFDKKGARYF